MKRFLVILLVGSLSSCISLASKHVEHVDVIEVTALKKDQIYIRINEWLVQHFYSAKAVIQFQDKEAGVVMGYYQLVKAQNVNEEPPRPFLKIESKDGKSRITFFADIPFFDTPLLGDKQKWPYGSEEIIKAKWFAEVESLREFLNKPLLDW